MSVFTISNENVERGGGVKYPKHFGTLTVLSMIKQGLSILRVNFFFGVKNHSKIKTVENFSKNQMYGHIIHFSSNQI